MFFEDAKQLLVDIVLEDSNFCAVEAHERHQMVGCTGIDDYCKLKRRELCVQVSDFRAGVQGCGFIQKSSSLGNWANCAFQLGIKGIAGHLVMIDCEYVYFRSQRRL